MHHNQRYKQAKKVTVFGGGTNILLGFMKIIGGILFNSHALFADGLHSFSDVVTDLMVIFASKYGSQDADASHPYGHQRIETAATLLLSLLLILTGAAIAWDAFMMVIENKNETPQFLSIPIAIVSIMINEAFFHYTLAIGKKINSNLLIANAWHHRSDAGSSLIVLLGLIFSIYGLPILDSLVAIIIGILIIKMGINYGWNSVKELIDTSVDTQTLIETENLVRSIDGIQKIHQLRSRRMGKDIFLDLHIQVSPWISVSEGHFIAQNVHYSLIKNNPEIKDVTVHVDPEDDESSKPSQYLPTRNDLENQCLLNWKKLHPEITEWNLHYIDGKIHIDIMVDSNFTDLEKLTENIQHDLQNQTNIYSLKIYKISADIKNQPTL